MDYKGYKIDKITRDDMPNEIFKDIADDCGIEAAVSLLRNFSGCTISVPTNGLNRIEKKIILTEYDGSAYSIKNLARNLEKAESSIREILKSYKVVPAETGQLNLFKVEELKK